MNALREAVQNYLAMRRALGFRLLLAGNALHQNRFNTNANLNYSFNEGNSRSLTINADLGYFDIKSTQHQPNKAPLLSERTHLSLLYSNLPNNSVLSLCRPRTKYVTSATNCG